VDGTGNKLLTGLIDANNQPRPGTPEARRPISESPQTDMFKRPPARRHVKTQQQEGKLTDYAALRSAALPAHGPGRHGKRVRHGVHTIPGQDARLGWTRASPGLDTSRRFLDADLEYGTPSPPDAPQET